MTIPEYAKSKGKTRQAIYQKLTVYNIDRSSLLDETGNLTEEGLKTLDFIMKKPHKKPIEQKTVNNTADALQAVLTAKEAETEALKKQIDTLTERCEELQKQINDITGQCDEWHNLFLTEKQKADSLTNVIVMQSMKKPKRLSAGDGESFLHRIFSRNKQE